MFQRYRDIQERRHSFEADSGFTLIELLIVIVVLGILAAIVVFSLTGVSGQSKAAACTSDGKTVEIAADAYQAYYGSYPGALSDLTPAYLHALPGTANGYTISLDTAADTVDANGTAYDSSTGCAALG